LSRRFFSLAVFFVIASSCGDRPWPMDNPNDPLRCDPQCQSPFVCENAACVYDPCRLNACNGHGTCSADGDAQTFTCRCNEGWSGTECNECAAGYTGYPDCHCQCSSGQTQCEGQSLKTCDSSCSWTSQTCAQVCQDKSFSYGFCSASAANSSQQCYCGSSGSAGAIEFKLTANCTTSIAIYDGTTKKALSSIESISASNSFSHYITCEPGESVCWGAWSESYRWGCGSGCLSGCTDCCTTCPSSGKVIRGPNYDSSLPCSLAGTGGTGGSRGTGGTGGSRGTGGTGGSSRSTGGSSGSGGKGGSGGGKNTKPIVNCSEFSTPECEVGTSSIVAGDTCIRAGCSFSLEPCTTHGEGFSSYQTCECRCY